MSPHTATHAYVGRCPGCHGWVMLRVDTQDKDTARDVAECIRHGCPVNRVPMAKVKEIQMCETRGECKPGEPAAPAPSQMGLFGGQP